jgi:hypothetical protein
LQQPQRGRQRSDEVGLERHGDHRVLRRADRVGLGPVGRAPRCCQRAELGLQLDLILVRRKARRVWSEEEPELAPRSFLRRRASVLGDGGSRCGQSQDRAESH